MDLAFLISVLIGLVVGYGLMTVFHLNGKSV